MRSMKNASRTLAAAGSALLLLSACSGDQKHAEEPSDGTMEKAGEAVDDTADDVEEGAEDAAESAGEAAEDTGDAVEDATKDED